MKRTREQMAAAGGETAVLLFLLFLQFFSRTLRVGKWSRSQSSFPITFLEPCVIRLYCCYSLILIHRPVILLLLYLVASFVFSLMLERKRRAVVEFHFLLLAPRWDSVLIVSFSVVSRYHLPPPPPSLSQSKDLTWLDLILTPDLLISVVSLACSFFSICRFPSFGLVLLTNSPFLFLSFDFHIRPLACRWFSEG